VDADVRAVEIAQRLADPVRHGLTNVPTGSPVAGIVGHGKSRIKRHVETRHARSSWVELDTREVVNGVGTSPDELEDSLKTALAGGDFERRARDQPKSAQTGNVGQIEVFKRSVVGNVSEIRNTGQVFFEALLRAYFKVVPCRPFARARFLDLRPDKIL
jgi:hypothetical protein